MISLPSQEVHQRHTTKQNGKDCHCGDGTEGKERASEHRNRIGGQNRCPQRKRKRRRELIPTALLSLQGSGNCLKITGQAALEERLEVQADHQEQRVRLELQERLGGWGEHQERLGDRGERQERLAERQYQDW